MDNIPESTIDFDKLEQQVYTTYIYTDIINHKVMKNICDKLGPVEFIIRDEEKWNIRYITGIIMDPNVKIIVVHNINEMSIAEITLASFMCKTILCVTDTIKEYEKSYDMVTDFQTGCNLTINNNSFTNWYKTKRL